MRYAVVIKDAGGNFSAYVPDLPGCVATGRTVAETEVAIREAIVFHLEGLREDGSPYNAGQILRNPDYARTLRHLAEYGPEDFYQGELARRMSQDLAANNSFGRLPIPGGLSPGGQLPGLQSRDQRSTPRGANPPGNPQHSGRI